MQTEAALKEALSYLEKSRPSEATKILSPLFEYEFDCPELIFTSACCNFWVRRFRKASELPDSFEKGEMLLADWKEFKHDFVAKRQLTVYPPTIQASERGVFSVALQNFQTAAMGGEKGEKGKGAVAQSALRRAALCYKKLGDYDEALKYLSKAQAGQGTEGTGSTVGETRAETLAQTADCYALCGGDRNAKVLFREAFFVSPDDIDLDMLDCSLIRCLIEKTEALGYKGNLLQRWLPVWGTLWGVLCVKRGMNATEAIKLRQQIFSLENEMDVKECDKEAIVPRLLNLYFWYIDYLSLVRAHDSEAQKTMNDVLLKIKILDKNVYEVYKR